MRRIRLFFLVAWLILSANGIYCYEGREDTVKGKKTDQAAARPPAAKRVAPREVKPVVYRGVRYEAPHFGSLRGADYKGGHVAAYDVKTGKQLWELEVYTTIIREDMESDVQDVFITQLLIKRDRLIVINENDKRFELDPKTGRRFH